MHAYRMTGLNIASEIVLPGARAGSPAATPDIVIRRAEVPLHLPDAVIAQPAWETAGDRFLVRASGTGRFLLTGGCHIGFQPEAGISAADCGGHLVGSVFGLLLHQRREIALHASAVLIDGKAILICGRSGLGKSTLAAALCLRGHPFVADDICAISFDADANPRVSTHCCQIKLAADAVAAFGLTARYGDAPPRGLDKVRVDPPVEAGEAEFPIGRIYILRPYTTDQPQKLGREKLGREKLTSENFWPLIQSLASAQALRLLQRNAYRPGVVKRTGQTARYFEASAMIVRKVGVLRLSRARDLSHLSATVDLIERQESEQDRQQEKQQARQHETQRREALWLN